MDKKNILIICWDFPPNNSIGGRRWAKFAKSLLKQNYNIHVVTHRANTNSKQAFWISDEELGKMKSYYFTNHFLVGWLNDYTSLFRFFKIHTAELLLRIFFKGTIFDKAIGIEKIFLKEVSEIIKQQAISTVFVTGAPFNLLYYTAKLKNIFPDLKIISDYRDPWINAQNYGMQNLSKARKNEELRKQNYVFENVDYITAPNSFLLSEIKETYTGNASKIANFLELPHAFDPDDIIKNNLETKDAGKIRIVYAGTLYIGSERYLTFLNESINHFKSQLNDVKFKIDFYTSELSKTRLFSENLNYIEFHKPVGEKIFNEVIASDFIFIFLSEHNKNYVTSKFFEFLPYKKPYLYIGPEGFVSKKIEQEGLGYHLKTSKDLYNIISDLKRKDIKCKSDIQKYTFDFVTQQFISEINKS